MKVYNVNVCAMLAFCGLKLEMSGLFAMSLTKHFVFAILSSAIPPTFVDDG
ncbi:hypothetical protein EM74_014370 [Vibrio parahaemolyticus]|nr:hypothetical protein [Vibrio parahaemolyticus]EGR3250581.1 hypothetical protein [Vibrio parahaemolyticus]OQU49362.1 hypothetical protein EM74_014370 [Vibrio parahaemolyticus]